ncbi:MAG TPA: Tol-Pal system beta propeller repeat protein TolB [bacterium]|nr:Tol-Pal system beta propeller repeat protein TolB [bacterium]
MRTAKFFTAVALMAVAGAAGGQTRIKVSKHYADSMRMAVPLFANLGPAENSRMARSLTNLLIDDLTLSGYFLPVENRAFVEEAEQLDRRTGKLNLKEWAATGAQVLIKGGYSVEGGRITIECRVVDISKGRQVFGKQYALGAEAWRDGIHALADEIVRTLTGERGLARTQIAFVSSDRGEKAIYLMEGCGQNWRKINSGKGIAINPDWAPDGNALVYTAYSSGFPWVIYDDLASGQRRVIASFPGLNAFAAVSPDGRWVALTLSRDGNNEIYRMRLDGSSLERLTRSRGNDCSPSWSPDGTRLAFTSDRGGTPQIYIMNADGSNPRRLGLTGSYNSSPAWSPRGDMIAYSSLLDGNFEICIVDLDSGSAQRLTRNRWNDEDPSWAPDNRHLVYSSDRGGTTNLFVIDLLNPEPLQLTRGLACTSPAWGPYRY